MDSNPSAAGYLAEFDAVQADYQPSAVIAAPPVSPTDAFLLLLFVETLLLGGIGAVMSVLLLRGPALVTDGLLAGVAGAAIATWRSARHPAEVLQPLPRQMRHLLPRLCLAALAAALVLLLGGARGLGPCVWLVGWIVLAACGTWALRAAVAPTLRQWRASGRMARHVAVVGSTPAAQQVIDQLHADPAGLVRIVGLFDDLPQDAVPPQPAMDEVPAAAAPADEALQDMHPDLQVRGDIDALRRLSRRARIDTVIVTQGATVTPGPASGATMSGAAEVCRRLRGLVADVYLAAAPDAGATGARAPDWLATIPLTVVARHRLRGWQALQKSAFDRVAGVVALVLLSPLLLTIAILIKFDSRGPVLFRQPRIGFNNRSFVVFKFRSMFHDMRDLQAERQTSRDDPRVTRVGRVLRRLSLDELPQLLNVLRGDMSLVGPRPHTLATKADGLALDVAEPAYAERHQVKPGITGWAQVNGSRGEIRTVEQIRKRVRLDLDYIERWSFMLDIRILVLTVQREIFSSRAF